MLVEVCANSLESALNAERAGADRIELCSELAVGGITPSYGLLKAVSEQISIPVNVLIRPRSGDFTYSSDEIELMKINISLCIDLGFNGIVTGVLKKDFTLDVDRTEELRNAGKQLQFTFHRAFDWVLDPFDTLQRLEEVGVNTILTSGQQKSAIDGIELLSELHKRASSAIIMPGAGINVNNAHNFKEMDFNTIHLSAVSMVEKLSKAPKISMNSPQLVSDDSIAISNFETIQEVVSSVK